MTPEDGGSPGRGASRTPRDMLHRAHALALLLAGRPLPLLGRLLADTTREGAPVLLDPETGEELNDRVDDRPAFVLSTEGEATDGHIVRQHWDLVRAAEGGPGVPVLWGHNPDRLLGQWQDLSVRSLETGPMLVGRAYLDPEDEEAQHRRGQIRRGILNAVSTGWIPGERVRRGDLPDGDPLWKPREEDDCGMPMEGHVMGSARQPNHLVEASLVSTPAQVSAVVTERLHRGAERAAGQLTRGLPAEPQDLDKLLAVLARDARVTAWIDRRIAANLALRSLPLLAPTTGDNTALDFFNLLKK